MRECARAELPSFNHCTLSSPNIYQDDKSLLLLLLWVLLIKQIENRKKIDNQKTTGWFTLLGHYRQWQTVSSI